MFNPPPRNILLLSLDKKWILLQLLEWFLSVRRFYFSPFWAGGSGPLEFITGNASVDPYN